MKNKFLTFGILLILLNCRLAGYAQQFLPVCKNFGIEDYAEDAEFQCAVSDNTGTMYFGTNFGILIYRGEKRSTAKSWQIMLLPDPDIIRSLYLDSISRRLYVGGQNDFGYFQLSAYNKGKFVSLGKQLSSSYKQNTEAWHIYKLNSQFVFHSLHGLLVYEDGKELKVIPAPENGIFHNVFQLRTGALLMNSIENGWFIYDGTLKPVALHPELPIDKCYSVLNLKEKNKYLFFFRNEGIYKVTLTGYSFSEIQKVSNPGFDLKLSEDQLYGAVFNNDSSKIIIATLTKGALIANYTGFFSEESVLSETQSGTNILSVYGLYTDKLRNTWVLGKSNLSLLPSDLSLIHKDFRGITVNGLVISHDRLYVAAANGLYSLSLQNNLLSKPLKLAEGPFNKPVVVNDTVYTYTLYEIFAIYNDKVRSFQSPSPIKNIARIKGKLWIANNDGLYIGLTELEKNKPVSSAKNVLQLVEVKNEVYALIEDVGLTIFSLNGKVVEERKLGKEFTSAKNVKIFNEDGEFILSNLRNTYHFKNHTISPIDTTAIKLWMYKIFTNGGAIKFEYDNSNVTALKLKEKNMPDFRNANSFMSTVEVNDAEFYKGYYYLATKNGLCVSKLITNKPPQAVRIFGLKTDSLEFLDKDMIQIPYDSSKSIEVFCSLNSFYSSFDNTQYTYKLSNGDDINQFDTQSNSNFSFNNLPWGNYTLEVKANYGNDEATEPAVLHFTILKPWWATVWAIIMYCVAFILFIYGVVQLSVYRLKQSKIKLEQIVEERTAEVVHQKNEIEVQKVEIENKNHEITDSINYAQRIQNSLLKGEDKLKAVLPGAFVLYMPKDIVSGDFYWFSDILHYHVIAVADCTGHGVPGAFMSMLGVAKLNELAAKNIYMPDELLHELNHLIVETLGQKMVDSDSRDGMDAALICIDTRTGKLFYAGANRPLYIVDRNENRFEEIKPTKLPVGGGQYGENRDYQLHELDINKNVSVYLSTDGYADQFGGPKGKKFMTSRLHKILTDFTGDTPEEQKKKLENSYLQWKGKLEQVDDVCLVGINFDAR